MNRTDWARSLHDIRIITGIDSRSGLASSSSRWDILSRTQDSSWRERLIMRHLQPAIFAALSILFAVAGPGLADADEVGVSQDAILFGQAAALEGPSSALGQGMRQGIVAAFAEVNAKGGIFGRKLKLISRDDGYDPDRSVAQSTKLIEEDKVFALIGAVGTPTTTATVPIAKA